MGEIFISTSELYRLLGSPDAPLIYDVCRCEDYDAEPRLIPGARWRDHRRAAEWAQEIPRGQRVVTVCVGGKKVSQAAAAELRLQGIDAASLAGGNEAWRAAGHPTVAKRLGIGNREGRATRWVTRSRPKIDRIACPWLIARFLDPVARFFCVDPAEVIAAAAELDAIPFDVDGVELSHRGERDSFDAFLEDFGLEDAALDRLAAIIRGADTARMELAPEAAGLLAVSLGISALSGPDDHLALERGFAVYDALYAWARFASDETHNWPATRIQS
jgi:rhodanese-related sulfurtransferase